MASELHVDAIKHSGGTSALTIDSSGRILTPARPSFRAKLSGSATTVSSGNDIVFDDVTTSTHGCHNIGGHYSTSNGKFTAPIAGVYFFSFSVYRNNAADAEVNMFLGSQAVGVAREKSDGASYDTMNLTTTLKLSASDEVKIRCIDGTIYIDTNVHSFSGFLLG
tara:strand:+ start:445 stop:939 length:495 start_codon:yes stop_codon:yes gene_type:complete